MKNKKQKLLIFVILMLGCREPNNYIRGYDPSVSYSSDVIKEVGYLRYFKDERTNKCFLYYDGNRPAMACVPCDSVVLAVIEKQHKILNKISEEIKVPNRR
jgi:hypothetical protein